MDNLDWHERFSVQAKWTKQLRQYLYQQVGINEKSRVLEVGCGTGVITSELKEFTKIQAAGIDIQLERVASAKEFDTTTHYVCADVNHLPFINNHFDFVVAHYLFLWLREPVQAFKEIKRVIKPGGFVVALAEPDYLARIDNPMELWTLGEMQTKALIQQGANPMAGRQLSTQLYQAGFAAIQYGISGFQAESDKIPPWFDSEWKILENDLELISSPQELDKLRQLDLAAQQKGSRVRWVPTFYAYGRKDY
ncbi:MAG: class I SAM-dependent methyltransferase [Anaerolineae bacterium]|nr:class I SAM-dependent methyltransferase [Anaerolineae bacterium]